MTPEWKEYAVGPIGSPTCTAFTKVTHTAHLRPAIDIVRDGQVKAGLVYDESRLNRTRTLVVWVSPNYWYDGFIYGGTQFAYDWQPLVTGKRFYYVETMREYNPHACRILITDQEHPELAVYDPTRRDGPWWQDSTSGTHYYHGQRTLEFMLETSLDIEGVREMDFQAHHPRICNVHERARFCPEAKLTREDVRARFIATLVGEALASSAPSLATGEGVDRRAGNELLRAWFDLERKLRNLGKAATGAIGKSHPTASALARAILFRFGRYEFDDVKALASSFSSGDELAEALRSEAEAAFHLPPGDLLRDD